MRPRSLSIWSPHRRVNLQCSGHRISRLLLFSSDVGSKNPIRRIGIVRVNDIYIVHLSNLFELPPEVLPYLPSTSVVPTLVLVHRKFSSLLA